MFGETLSPVPPAALVAAIDNPMIGIAMIRSVSRPGIICVVGCLVAIGSAQAQQSPTWSSNAGNLEPVNAPVNSAGEGFVDIEPCFTMLISDIDVPAQESGPLTTLSVREGQLIEAAQELARINDSLGQLRLETARTKLDNATQKAGSDIDIRAAQNALEIADSERRTNYGLYNKGSLPKQEYDRSALQAKQAELQLEQAQRDQDASMKEVQIEQLNVHAATDSIERHRILSPIQGNVLELYKQAGEWVNAGDNVMRVARMDQLYVQGLLDASLHNPHEIQGRAVTVTAQLAHGEQVEFTGRIVFVALEKNSTRYYSVRAEVDNRMVEGYWLLLSNEEVRMRIHLDQPAIARTLQSTTYR